MSPRIASSASQQRQRVFAPLGMEINGQSWLREFNSDLFDFNWPPLAKNHKNLLICSSACHSCTGHTKEMQKFKCLAMMSIGLFYCFSVEFNNIGKCYRWFKKDLEGYKY